MQRITTPELAEAFITEQVAAIRQQVYNPNKPTSLPVVEGKEGAFKRMENGQMIICRDGHKYTSMGQKL